MTSATPEGDGLTQRRLVNRYWWRLHDHSRRRSIRRKLARIERLRRTHSSVDRSHRWLAALLLIETLERPALHRGIEHAMRLVRRRTTAGPFQLREAPGMSFDAHAIEAAARLSRRFPRSGSSPTVDEVARFWNGAAGRQPGAALGYAEVLSVALDVLTEGAHAK